MRFGKTFLLCGLAIAFASTNISSVEAQLRRRSSVLQSKTVRRTAVTKKNVPVPSQRRDLVVSKIVNLSPDLPPAKGPEGSQGIAYIYYNDENTLLNSGRVIVSGLPKGEYYVWLIFIDLLSESKIFSELVAEFNINQDNEQPTPNSPFGARYYHGREEPRPRPTPGPAPEPAPGPGSDRTEVELTFGSPEVINISKIKQLVLTKKFPTEAGIGKEPVSGAAGYPGEPGAGEAILAADLNRETSRSNKVNQGATERISRRQSRGWRY